ncbi:hypothetical protein [Pantoea sp. B65]|uniref:hypothetical protein n=1 Tax=Pantoea sp. B65 TaxID=2813359 RepID=UPI0039B4C74C
MCSGNSVFDDYDNQQTTYIMAIDGNFGIDNLRMFLPPRINGEGDSTRLRPQATSTLNQ